MRALPFLVAVAFSPLLVAASAATAHADAPSFDPAAMSADFDLLAGQRRIGPRPVIQIDPGMLNFEYGIRLIVTESYSGKIADSIEDPPSSASLGSGAGFGAFFGVKMGALSFGAIYDSTTATVTPPSGPDGELNFNSGLVYASLAIPLSGKPNSKTGMFIEGHVSVQLPVLGELVDEDGDGLEGISGFGFEGGLTFAAPMGTGAGTTGMAFYFQVIVNYRTLSYADLTSGGSATDGDIDVLAITLSACLRM